MACPPGPFLPASSLLGKRKAVGDAGSTEEPGRQLQKPVLPTVAFMVRPHGRDADGRTSEVPPAPRPAVRGRPCSRCDHAVVFFVWRPLTRSSWLPVGSRWNVLAVVLSAGPATRTKGPGRLRSQHARGC